MAYSDNILTGGTATASRYFSDLGLDCTPSKAVDGSITDDGTSSWLSSDSGTLPEWWQYQLSEAKAVTKLRIFAANWSLGYSNALKDFSLKGSNNGSSWDTIYTGQQTNDIQWQEYEFENSIEYLYYRIYITSSYGDWGTWGCAGITEIEMMTTLAPTTDIKKCIEISYSSIKKIMFTNIASVKKIIGIS